MSVTDTKRTHSRNAAVVYGAPTGCECGAWMPMWQAVDGDGQAVGDAKPLGMHCLTCHSDRHNACVDCGACLPDWAPSFGKLPWERYQRRDARYCSNACRQRAYRKRKEAASG